MANVLDYDIVISEFELQWRYYIYLRKGMNPIINRGLGVK